MENETEPEKKVIKRRKTKLNPSVVAAELLRMKGYIYLSAKNLGIDAETIYNYAKKFPEVQQAIDMARGQITDVAEMKLYEHIKNGNLRAIIYQLSTQGKNRGYTKATETIHSGEIEIDLDRIKEKLLQRIAKETNDETIS